MEPAADPRRLAWEVLIAVDEGAFADAELGRRSARAHLAPRDQALAARLVYGTLAWQGFLDHLLAGLGRPAASLDPPLRTLIRLALFQLTKLSRVPDFAAVDTAVELSKTFRRGAASGLVNALLRRFLRERDHIGFPARVDDLASHLAVTGSHPRWLVERWLIELGAERTEALLAADNEAAPTVLRVNRLKISRAELMDALAAAGVTVHPEAAAPDAIVLDGGADPASLAGYAEGLFSSQGEASQLVAVLLDAQPGERVLDACAAPGGKTTYVAERMKGEGSVRAIDLNAVGLEHVARAARRLGLRCIQTVAADAADPTVAAGPTFDRVLLDAPCSGLGTLRQHPEIRWRRTPATLAEAATLQGRLVRALADRVRPGGVLVYATCTLVRIENDDIVDAFLADRPDFIRDDPRALPAAVAPFVDDAGVFRTAPYQGGLDGFFAVRLKRRG